MISSDIIPRIVYNGDGTITRFSITFAIQSTTDADARGEVYGYITDPDGVITLITENFDVDVSEMEYVYPTAEAMEGDSEIVPLPTGYTLTLIRVEDITQLLQLITNGGWKIEQVVS